MKRLLLSLTAASAGVVMTAEAAIQVPSGGITVNFATQPLAADWSTASIAGGGGDISRAWQVDYAVQPLTSGTITTQVGNNGAMPHTFVQWNSGQYLET